MSHDPTSVGTTKANEPANSGENNGTELIPQPHGGALREIHEAEVGSLTDEPGWDAVYAGLRPRARDFLTAFREVGTVTAAADLIGISRQTHYKWKRSDPLYADAFKLALREVNDALEALLHERVQNGLREERYDAEGNLMYYRIRHDPSLMKMLLQSRMPERYGRDGHAGEQITIIIQDVRE